MQLDEFMARVPKGDFWVFGYGSLMWSPCFSYEAKGFGRAHGYHRALCILSTRYRGTHRRPGLVMGLCRGGSCWGMAFRIARSQVRRALSRLWAREMPRRVYHPRLVSVRLRSGRTVRALAFVADPTHSAYVDELDLHGRAKLVAQGIGVRGPCVDYIQNTLDHMHEVGVRDPHLERVLDAALALRRGDGGSHARKGLAQTRALRAKVQPHEARIAKLRTRG
ncbi:MAG: glutathione-specific gamma-glutamylcyclotransferase [Betaproteobacteria bacterium]|jgi:cation transport protein ChaC|nr:glutathione-specific gamma-glutamylcyclotransferase [Betaproteobacteria bacterium]